MNCCFHTTIHLPRGKSKICFTWHLYPKAATVTHPAREQKLGYCISFLSKVKLDILNICYIVKSSILEGRMPKLEWFVGNFWLIVAMISAAVMGGHDLLF